MNVLDELNHPLMFGLAILLIAIGGPPIFQYFTNSRLPGSAQVARKA